MNILLVCPDCKSSVEGVACTSCKRTFAVVDGIYCMMPSAPRQQHSFYDNPYHQQLRERQADFYNDLYREGSLTGLGERMFKQALKKMTNYTYAPILDLGCGIGDGIELSGASVGVDVNLDLLRVCRKRFPEIMLVQGDVFALPFRDGAFKTIFAQAILEHLFLLEVALGEISRVLDGNLYALVPNEGGFAWNTTRRLFSASKSARAVGLSASEYLKAARIEHCNTVEAVDSALRKFFSIEEMRHWPFDFGGNIINLIRLYRLKALR